MIQANELRVGNWVLCESFMGKNKLRITEIVETDSCKDLFPIPLTEEILLKAGFKELNYGWYAKEYFTDSKEVVEVMSIQYNLNTGVCGVGDTDFGGCNAYIGNIFFNLHILQNVFYYLSGGKELEVNI